MPHIRFTSIFIDSGGKQSIHRRLSRTIDLGKPTRYCMSKRYCTETHNNTEHLLEGVCDKKCQDRTSREKAGRNVGDRGHHGQRIIRNYWANTKRYCTDKTERVLFTRYVRVWSLRFPLLLFLDKLKYSILLFKISSM